MESAQNDRSLKPMIAPSRPSSDVERVIDI
jgi:hypothetical protein